MASLKELRAKHTVMVRYTLRALAHLQALMYDKDTPEHIKPHLTACRTLLERGLMAGPPEEPEKVVIAMVGRAVRIVSKPEYVEVVIHDTDEGWGKAL